MCCTRSIIFSLYCLSIYHVIQPSSSDSSSFLSKICKISEIDAEALIKNFTFINVKESDVTFYVYESRASLTQVVPTTISSFLTHPETVVLIHGWGGSKTVDYITVVAQAYAQVGGHNIIIVDWSGPAGLSYCVAASAVKGVGGRVADFIQGTSLPGLHVFGHSLGAHVAGFTGALSKTKLPWITGADPAGPLFADLGIMSNMLDSSDAQFVDVIHTNVGFYGTVQTCGDIDFYVSCGGPFQIKCMGYILTDFITAVSCSHQMSCSYYAQSILQPGIYNGTKCDACTLGIPSGSTGVQVMGDSVDKNATGVYCVSILSQ